MEHMRRDPAATLPKWSSDTSERHLRAHLVLHTAAPVLPRLLGDTQTRYAGSSPRKPHCPPTLAAAWGWGAIAAVSGALQARGCSSAARRRQWQRGRGDCQLEPALPFAGK